MNYELGIRRAWLKIFLVTFLFLILNSLLLTPANAQNNSLIKRFSGSLLPAPVVPTSLRVVAPRIAFENPPLLFSPRIRPSSLISNLRAMLLSSRSNIKKSPVEPPNNPQVRAYVFPSFLSFFKEGRGMDNRATVNFVPINFQTQDVLRTTVSCGQQPIADGEGFIAQVRIDAGGLVCKASLELENVEKPVETFFNLPIS